MEKRQSGRKGILAGALFAAVGFLLLIVPDWRLDGFDEALPGGVRCGVPGARRYYLAFMVPRSRAVDQCWRARTCWRIGQFARRRVRAGQAGHPYTDRAELAPPVVLGWWILWVAVFLVIGPSRAMGTRCLFVGIMAAVLLVVTAAGLGILSTGTASPEQLS